MKKKICKLCKEEYQDLLTHLFYICEYHDCEAIQRYSDETHQKIFGKQRKPKIYRSRIIK